MNQVELNQKTKLKTIEFLKSIGYKLDDLIAANFIASLNLRKGNECFAFVM